MKMITGGVGVEAVSNSSGITFYVNEAFATACGAAPGGKCLGLSKITRATDGWDIHLSPSSGRVQRPYLSGRKWLWRTRWSGASPKPEMLPIGGITPITALSPHPDGGVVITIPSKLIMNGMIGCRRERKEVIPPIPAPRTTFGLSDLKQAVLCVNEIKADMGDALVLSIDSAGNLKAMLEIG